MLRPLHALHNTNIGDMMGEEEPEVKPSVAHKLLLDIYLDQSEQNGNKDNLVVS